jgi:putative transposase
MIQDYRKVVRQRTGGIKLYAELNQDFINQDIKIGRDKLYDVLKLHNLLVPKLKNYVTTTNSNHLFRKFKNLTKDKVPNRPEQLWVSDITYIKTDKGHNYLAIATDAYAKQIMGYKLDNNKETSLCTKALTMVIKNRKYPNKKRIHHSDSRFQYCNLKYTEFAESNGIMIPMTKQYGPYENAIAEKINRTLKYEYGLRNSIKNTEMAQQITKQSVSIYNNLRTHFSLDLRKPAEVHLKPHIKYKSYRRNNVYSPELKNLENS